MKLSELKSKIQSYIDVCGDKNLSSIRVQTGNIDISLHEISSVGMSYQSNSFTIIFKD